MIFIISLSEARLRNRRQEILTGFVNWFQKTKGFGFITCDSDGMQIFYHFKDIKSTGFRILEEGQRVRFVLSHEVIQGKERLVAKEIEVI